MLGSLLVISLLARSAVGKSVKDYIADGIAAGRECLSEGCFLSGLLHPGDGELYYPATVVFDKDVLTSGEEVGCYRIPSVLQNPETGVIHAFAEARFGSEAHFECADCSVLGIAHRSSTDGGLTWGESKWVVDHSPTDPTDPTSNVGGNVVTLWDGVKGRIVLHFVRGVNQLGDCVPGNSNWEVVSEDDGLTWSTPRDISPFLGPYVGVLPGPGTGVQLEGGPRAGRIVVPAHYGTAYRDYGSAVAYYSDDHGETWAVTSTPLPLMDECAVVEIGDGGVMINMRNADEDLRQRAVAVSYDGGETFGEVVFDPQLPDPICEASINRVEGSAGDGGEGVLIFSNPDMQYSRSRLTVKFSDDQGVTWGRSLLLADRMSDYSSLVSGSLGGEGEEGGVLWGSCNKPMPWRVWCEDAREWNVLWTRFPLDGGAGNGVEVEDM
ncbi:hypothetical protein TrCOL_g7804 [Triparma columacea]|uniref:Sialidase domain-containing protein n=1 Tax=Triparma columacea TaxID=722753 RepID=A0A9W7GI91_9STRA|nr:hypothetical protein TrCOL_g7804 [Triparma columacea]